MKIDQSQSETAVMRELGERVRSTQLSRGLSQAELAARAGVSTVTISKFESGELGQTRTLLRVLQALELTQNLDPLIPQQRPSPIRQSDLARDQRKRAPRKRSQQATSPWKWGDES